MRYALVTWCALSFASLSGCVAQVADDEQLGDEQLGDEQSGAKELEIEDRAQALTPGVPVRLLWAKTASRCVQYTEFGSCLNNLAQAVLSGYVEVDNLAFDKQVVIRYQSQGGDWIDAVARYVAPTRSNAEAWYFETQPKTYSDRLGTEFPFAIRYTANGQSYWDNNSGANYRVGGGPRTFSPSLLLEAANLTLTELRWGLDRVDAQVAVKNLGYEKNVLAVYTTDGWRTVQRAQATYQYSPSGYEYWTLAMPVNAGAAEIELAVSYTVNGRTYWDNNFGRNYTLSKPSQL